MADFGAQREYRITDSELTMFGQHICDSITRDITEFGVYGVVAADVTALQALIDAFELFPTDDYVNQEYRTATANKDALTEEVRVLVRSMALRVEMKWGKKSTQYKSLRIADMTLLTDEAFLTRARMVHSFMVENLTELASGGLTQAMLDDMEDKLQQLDDAKRLQIDKSCLREDKTVERIEKGNQLYTIISKYCEIGKRIWDKVNPARFNDYIIYQKEAGGLSVPANFRYDFIGKTFWWDVVSHATSYQLERKHEDEYVQIYAGKDPQFQYTPPDGQGFYRVRARNMNGFGPATEDLEQWYFAVLPPASNLVINDSEMNPGQYRLSWDAVPTATEYSVYRSVVNNGQPAGDYSLQGKTAEASFVISTESGKRNYFRVNTKNLSQYAVPSEPVWIEI